VRSAPPNALKQSPYKPDDKLINIKLKIRKDAAFRALDDFGNCTLLPSGEAIVEMEIRDSIWLPGFLLSYGDSLEVLEPLSLKNEILKQIENIKKLYTGDI